jgi:mRNA interferase RelE/StbE
MTYSLDIIPRIRKQLRKLPAEAEKIIRQKLKLLAVNPYSPELDIKKLSDRNSYRLRVGVWRVIYEIHKGVLIIRVVEIGHRREVYH